MSKSAANRTAQRALLDEKPEIGHELFLVISAVMLIDDLLFLLIILSLELPWLVANVAIAVNVLVFGFLFIFIHSRRVCLTDRMIVVRFGIFRSSIPLSSVRSVTIQNPPRWQRLGGLVSPFRGRLVYCFKRSSPFVMVERDSRILRTLYFNVSNAPDFIRKLNKATRIG
jgi:hypothetical protein